MTTPTTLAAAREAVIVASKAWREAAVATDWQPDLHLHSIDDLAQALENLSRLEGEPGE